MPITNAPEATEATEAQPSNTTQGSMVFFGICVAVAGWAFGTLMATPEQPAIVLKPCVTETDTRDCYWDAEARGNGIGLSFVIIDGEFYAAQR